MKSQHAPTVASLSRDLQFVMREIVELKTANFELRQHVRKDAIKRVVEDLDRSDIEELSKLRDEAVRVLRLMVQRDVITQDELNEATA